MMPNAKSRVHVDLEDPLQSHACGISSSSVYVSDQHQNKYKYNSARLNDAAAGGECRLRDRHVADAPRLAEGGPVIKYKSSLNVLEDIHGHSCYRARSDEYWHLMADSPGASPRLQHPERDLRDVLRHGARGLVEHGPPRRNWPAQPGGPNEAGRKALRIRHMRGMEVCGRRPRGLK
jgi:hypothetical protein